MAFANVKDLSNQEQCMQKGPFFVFLHHKSLVHNNKIKFCTLSVSDTYYIKDNAKIKVRQLKF